MPGVCAGRRLPRLTVPQVLCITVLAGIVMIVNVNPIRPNDFWWHVQAGREIVATGHIPTGEGLSYTAPGVPYDNYKAFWLMETALIPALPGRAAWGWWLRAQPGHRLGLRAPAVAVPAHRG